MCANTSELELSILRGDCMTYTHLLQLGRDGGTENCLVGGKEMRCARQRELCVRKRRQLVVHADDVAGLGHSRNDGVCGVDG